MTKKNEGNIKLTISLLVSNRKDTVPKCLESLKPLLNNVESELIITDTGCDVDLVEYMRTYTSNIVKFQWCNDFAKARNVGLKMARGQWFMFIDDDEWFEDVSEIIDFFNSGEYLEYEDANYIVRNYLDMSGNAYSECVVGRMFAIYDDTEFVGKVHECVPSKGGPRKQFLSYAHHYGYVFENEEKKRKHFERNSTLLKEEIAAKPSRARGYIHMYQEYRVLDDADTVLFYANEAIKKVDESDKGNMIGQCSTYVAIAWAHGSKGEFDKVIETSRKFLEEKPMTGLTRAALHMYMALAYYETCDYEHVVDCVSDYLKAKEMYRENKVRYYKEMGPMLGGIFNENYHGKTVCAGTLAALKIGVIDKVCEFILSYNWSNHIYMPRYELISEYADAIGNMDEATLKKHEKDIIRVLGKLFTNIECSNIFMKHLGEMKQENAMAYGQVCILMSQVAGQPGYKSLNTLMQVYNTHDTDKLVDAYIDVVSTDTGLLHMEKEFYEMAIEKDIPLGQMICVLPEDYWQALLDEWELVARNKDIAILKKYMDKLLQKDSVHMQLLEKKIKEILERRKK